MIDDDGDEIDFDEYLAIVKDEVRERGCPELPDDDTVRNDFFLEMPPSTSAELFVKQWRITEGL